MTYFEKIVLPSVKMAKKTKYTMDEAAIILDVENKQVLKFGNNYDNQTGRVRLKIEDGRVSFDTFVKFFSGADKPEA